MSIYSKSASEFYDPCQSFAERSLRCLKRNAFDKEMCGDYFQYVGIPLFFFFPLMRLMRGNKGLPGLQEGMGRSSTLLVWAVFANDNRTDDAEETWH